VEDSSAAPVYATPIAFESRRLPYVSIWVCAPMSSRSSICSMGGGRLQRSKRRSRQACDSTRQFTPSVAEARMVSVDGRASVVAFDFRWLSWNTKTPKSAPSTKLPKTLPKTTPYKTPSKYQLIASIMNLMLACLVKKTDLYLTCLT
jgi:hypothetical protein